MKLNSIKNQSNEYLELGINRFNIGNLKVTNHKSSILITSKLLSQEGTKLELPVSPKKLSYDCSNIQQIRKLSNEMELSSIHGRKANRNSHKVSCKTQNIPKIIKKNFCIEDDFILEEEDERLDTVKEEGFGLHRQKTVIIGQDSRIRSFSSIFSKLENIHERSNINLDSDSD